MNSRQVAGGIRCATLGSLFCRLAQGGVSASIASFLRRNCPLPPRLPALTPCPARPALTPAHHSPTRTCIHLFLPTPARSLAAHLSLTPHASHLYLALNAFLYPLASPVLTLTSLYYTHTLTAISSLYNCLSLTHLASLTRISPSHILGR
ncbi:hypothetical protein E2C01_029863 [Portunus trituberculatus]|uniref:Uncharacterized protein n=1 Tax=Portunus trituberculatus TaxID=210409 RepID=A0A5B7ETD0_PORTR|nr:hypothetical protein [Portunus trituberculatus]